MKKKTFSMVAPTSAMIILSLAVFILIGLTGTARAAVSTYHVLSSCTATRVIGGTPLTYALDSNPANCATPDDMRIPIVGSMDILIGIKAAAEVTSVDLTAQATGNSITMRNRGTGTLDCYIDLNEYTAADVKIQTLSTISFLSVPTADNTYTDFSGLTGTVASGNKWGLLLRCVDTATAPTLDMNGWGQVPAAATFSYYIAMDEVVGCADPDPTTAVNVTPATSATVGGFTTVQAEIVGEAAPETGSAAVTITGSSACNVAAAPMTWNAGSSRWEYSWNTAACGNPVESNAVTISVDYTDPDCSTVTNGSSTSITLDNTCVDATPSTITVTGAQTFNGDPYNAGAGFTTTGNVGSFEYFVVNATSATGPAVDEQEYFDNDETTCDFVNWTSSTATCADPLPNGIHGTHNSAVADNGDGTHTVSAGTGPTSLHSGTHGTNGGFAYIEASGTGPYTATLTRNAQFNADETELHISFAYAAYGANVDTLLLEANDGTGWVTEWQQIGDDGNAGAWTAVDLNLFAGAGLSAKAYTSGMVDLRFSWTMNSFAGDAAIDTIRVYGPGRTVASETTCTNWQASSSLPATTAGGSLCGDFADAGATHKLDVRGTDPDCGTLISSAGAQNFTWNACTDPDPVTAVNVTPATSATVGNPVLVQAEIVGEGTPSAGSATVTITGSSACDVTSQAMAWNAGSSRWEYSWNTTGCGDPVEANAVTITVSYTEPDCGTLTNGSSNNITLDTTCVASAPADLTAPTVTSMNVVVQWTGANCGTNNSYKVYRNGTAVSGDVACIAGTMQYDDTSVSADSTYNTPGFTVRASNTGAACETGDSNAVPVTTPPDPYLLSGCAGCHASPPGDDPGGIRNALTGAFLGSHNKHVAELGLACTECHNNNVTNAHRTGIINMASPINATAGAVYSKGSAFDQVNTPTLGTCDNTYCHSDGTSLASGTIPVNSSPTWGNNGSTTCTSCHSKPPAYVNATPKANTHAKHPADCSICHNATTTDGGSTITGPANHGNSAYNVISNSGQIGSYTFNVAGGTCNTISCHGNGNAQWGATLACADCHSGTVSSPNAAALDASVTTRRAAAGEFGMTWSHKRTAGGTVTSNDCGVCHMEGNASDGTSNATYHANGLVELRDPDTGATIKTVTFAGTPGSYTSTATDATFVRFSRNLASNVLETAVTAIQVNQCMKCHDAGGATSALAQVPGGSAARPFATAPTHTPGNNVLDIAAHFATTNQSYHPVMGRQNNSYADIDKMAAPWNQVTKTEGTTNQWGDLISCWDCHAPLDTPSSVTLTSTVTAHGGLTTLRGYPVATNYSTGVPISGSTNPTVGTRSSLCIICHANYDISVVGGMTSHEAGSAFSDNIGRDEKVPYLNYGCNICHSSGYFNAVARPTRSEDVHGTNVVPNGLNTKTLRWLNGPDFGPVSFIRNNDQFGVHSPASIGGNNYTPTCMSGNSGNNNCTRGGDEPYVVGGTY